MEAMAMNLQPLDDRIVVRPNESEQQTASGLVIPDTAKERRSRGLALSGCECQPSRLRLAVDQPEC